MRKTKRLGLTLTPGEKALVIRLADLEGGLSQAALVRRLVRKAAIACGLWSCTGQSRSADDTHLEKRGVADA